MSGDPVLYRLLVANARAAIRSQRLVLELPLADGDDLRDRGWVAIERAFDLPGRSARRIPSSSGWQLW